MTRSGIRALPLVLLAAVAQGEEFELGAFGGSGFMRNLAVASPHGAASTGFEPGFSAGALLGNDMYSRLGGEVRYVYRKGGLRLSSGGAEATFSGESHLIHYDLLFHASGKGSKVRPFVAGGAGARVFRGTGQERAFQPLIEFAALTRTQEVKPLVSIGGGVQIHISPRVRFRAEMRDYLSPFPKQVIAPVGGSRISGWVHDLMPLAGISWVF